MNNGYSESLFDTKDGVCFLTGKACTTARHEIFNGSNRANSKEDGLWINVSPEVHELLHKDKSIGSEWNRLQQRAELLWLNADFDRSINDFITRYGKNYL